MHYTPKHPHVPADKRPRSVRVASLWIGLAFLVNPSMVQAAAVINLSHVPRKIEVLNGNEVTPVVIEAGRKHEVIGTMKLRYHGQEFYIDSYEEYAIWKDGLLGPQFRQPNKRARN